MLESERQKRNYFYEWVEPDMKAEFINGEIIENSPATNRHTKVVGFLSRTASVRADFQNLGEVKSEKAMISLSRNDFEPDVVFWKKQKSELFTEGQLHFPAPDLAVEVLSKSTKKRDTEVKFADYALHGIGEYWINDSEKQTVDQYLLPKSGEKVYKLFKKHLIDDFIESVEMVNFRIPIAAIFDKEINKKTLVDLIQK
jgi:Uma2 family endonuclease